MHSLHNPWSTSQFIMGDMPLGSHLGQEAGVNNQNSLLSVEMVERLCPIQMLKFGHSTTRSDDDQKDCSESGELLVD